MTWKSRVIAFFPSIHFMSSLALGILFLLALMKGHPIESSVVLICCLVVLYLLPPILFRIHDRIFPLTEGFTRLDTRQYNPWWGGHQIQGLFIAAPFLESFLRLIPGAYSCWLRLWGAQVGKSVYWTPRTEIIDRSLVRIGDRAIFGFETTLCAHVIVRGRNGLRLYVAPISVGKDCLVGAKTRLGPGVRVEDGVVLPYSTEGWINQSFPQKEVERA